MANTGINLVSLDPDALKANFISYLQGQSQFADYNFSGSNINVLLDILSRNTFLMSFFLNMALSEAWLDSAQLIDSAVSRAKELNYTPRSVTSSSTTCNLTFSNTTLTSMFLPAPIALTGTNSNGTFTFTTDQNYYQISTNGYFSFSNVAVYDGTYTNDVFISSTNIPNQLFTISNPNIDISSLSVMISEENGSQNTVCTQVQNIYGLDGNSYVYYLQGARNGQYAFQFGDGVLGYQPQNGSMVVATYRVASGEVADGITSLTFVDNISALNGGYTIGNTYISMNANTDGGADRESLSSIQFNAPKSIQNQDRAVTSNDYKDLILRNYPQVGDVHVYGGGITPLGVYYGTAIIAAVSASGYPLTNVLKGQIISFLANDSMLVVGSQIVDPDPLNITVSSNVHINFNITNTSPETFESLVANSVLNYSSNNLLKFNTVFRYSLLSNSINNTDPAVISNETTINLKKTLPIISNVNTNLTFTYGNPVTSIESDYYLSNNAMYYISDQFNNSNYSNGTLFLLQVSANSSNIVTFSNVGTISYTNGNVVIPNIVVSAFTANNLGLNFTATPKMQDIYSYNNQIISIVASDISINTVNG